MLILREKIFGKLDAQEAKKLGITVAELRQRRAGRGLDPTSVDTVTVLHELINNGGNTTLSNSGINFAKEHARATRRLTNMATHAGRETPTPNQINQKAYFDTMGKYLDILDNASYNKRRIKVSEQEYNRKKMLAHQRQHQSPSSNPISQPVTTTTSTEPKINFHDMRKPPKTSNEVKTSRLQRVGNWMKNNPGKTAAGIAIGATAIGVGVNRGIKKLKDKKKKEE